MGEPGATEIEEPEVEGKEGEEEEEEGEYQRKRTSRGLELMEAFAECGVCGGEMTSPLLLPCLHALCSPCAGRLHINDGMGRCPWCRTPFSPASSPPPQPSTSPFPFSPSPSAFLCNYLSSQASEPANPNQITCEMCEEREAEWHCQQCSQFACPSCRHIHLRTKATRGHHLVSVDAAMREGGRPLRPMECPLHPGQRLEIYCRDCSSPVCTSCIPLEHSFHGFCSLEMAAGRLAREMQQALSLLRPKKEILSSGLHRLRSMVGDVNRQAEEACEAAGKTMAGLRDELDAKEKAVRAQIEEVRRFKEKTLLLQVEELEFMLEAFEAAGRYGETLVEEATPAELALERRVTMARLATLAGMNPTVDPPVTPTLEWEPHRLDDLLALLHDLGRVLEGTEACPLTSSLSLRGGGASLARGFVGEAVSLEVEVRDRSGRATSRDLGEAQVSVEGPDGGKLKGVEVLPLPDECSVAVCFVPLQPGEHTVSVTVRNRHVGRSPLRLGVVPPLQFLPRLEEVGERPSVRFGEEGSGDGQFLHPFSVCTNPGGQIIVADTYNHRVQVFSPEGAFLFKFGTNGSADGQFNQPFGIVVDPRTDNILIADSNNHRVQVFSPEGVFLFKFGANGSADGQFNLPWGIAVDEGGRIYVCDQNNHRVQVFEASGAFLFKFGSKGQEEGQLQNPLDVAFDRQGRLVVSEYSNQRLSLFDREGKFLRTLARGQISRPFHLFVDSADHVLVCDCYNNRVQVFDLEGRLCRTIGQDVLNGPTGISVDTKGRIIVSEEASHTISIF